MSPAAVVICALRVKINSGLSLKCRIYSKYWNRGLSKRVNPDHTPRNAAYDQGIHYLALIHPVKKHGRATDNILDIWVFYLSKFHNLNKIFIFGFE